MAADVSIITDDKSRLKFISPNNVHGSIQGIPLTPDYSDFCIYANLTVEVRKRMSGGMAGEDDTKTYNIVWVNNEGEDKINEVSFLQGDYLTTYYTDITARDILKQNQVEGLGISSINIDHSSYYLPQISIQFVDVRGSSVFGREESIHDNNRLTSENVFGVFFTIPYPKFRLQVKGFYGQAVTYQLACTSFKGRFDSNTGNFIIDTTFIGYQYSLLSDIPFYYLLVAPYCDYQGKHYWNKRIQDKDWELGNKQKMKTLVEYYKEIKTAMYENSTLGNNGSSYNTISHSRLRWLDIIQNNYQKAFASFTNVNNSEQAYKVTSTEDGYDENSGIRSYIAFYKEDVDYWTTTVNDYFGQLNLSIKSYNEDYPQNSIETIDFKEIYSDKELKKIFDNKKLNTNFVNINDPNSKDIGEQPISKVLISYIQENNTKWDNNLYGIIISDGGLLHKIGEERIKASSEESQLKITRNILSFIPSMGNIIKVIMAHLETLVYMMNYCADVINNNLELRNPERLNIKIFNTDVPVENSYIPPFPAIYKQDMLGNADSNTSSEGWPGDISSNFEEEKLVVSLMRAIQNMNDTNPIKTTKQRSEYIPNIPLDYIKGNPFDNNSWTVSSLSGVLAIRATQIFGIANNSNTIIDEELAKQHGEIDAYNLYKAVSKKEEIQEGLLEKVKGNMSDVLYNISLGSRETQYIDVYNEPTNDIAHKYYAFELYDDPTQQGVNENKHPIFTQIENNDNALLYSYITKAEDKKTALVPSKINTWGSIISDMNVEYLNAKYNISLNPNNTDKKCLYADSTYTVYKDEIDVNHNKYCEYKQNTSQTWETLINDSMFSIIEDKEEIQSIDDKIEKLKKDTSYTDFIKDNKSENFNKIASRYFVNDIEDYYKGIKLAKKTDDSYTEKSYDTTVTQLETDMEGGDDDFNRLVYEDYSENSSNQYIDKLLITEDHTYYTYKSITNFADIEIMPDKKVVHLVQRKGLVSIEFSDVFKCLTDTDNKMRFFLLLHTYVDVINNFLSKGIDINKLLAGTNSRAIKIPKIIILLLGGYLCKIFKRDLYIPSSYSKIDYFYWDLTYFTKDIKSNNFAIKFEIPKISKKDDYNENLHISFRKLFNIQSDLCFNDNIIVNKLIKYFLSYASKYEYIVKKMHNLGHKLSNFGLDNSIYDDFQTFDYFNLKRELISRGKVNFYKPRQLTQLENAKVASLNLLDTDYRKTAYQTHYTFSLNTYDYWSDVSTEDREDYNKKVKGDGLLINLAYPSLTTFYPYGMNTGPYLKINVDNYEYARKEVDNIKNNKGISTASSVEELRSYFEYFENQTTIDYCNYIDVDNDYFYYKSDDQWQEMLQDIFLSNVYVINSSYSQHLTKRERKEIDKKCNVYLEPKTEEEGSQLTIQKSSYNSYLNGFSTKIKSLMDAYYASKLTRGTTESLNNKYRDNCIPIYKYLKNLWDKWLLVAYKKGTAEIPNENDFSINKFFKNFIFIDSFYRNTYNLLLSDANIITRLIDSTNKNTSVFTVLSDIASQTKCLFLDIPDYIDLGNEDISGGNKGIENLKNVFRPIPFSKKRNMGLNNKFVFIYTHEPSKNVSNENGYNKDYITLCTDGTNLTNEASRLFATNTTGNEEINNMTRYGYDVPAFAVRFTSQNNHLWKNVEVTMDNPIATEISINVLSNIAELGSSNAQKVFFQGQDIYPIFSNYSYQCTVTMMGNMQIQPLMYFQLMNMPMWNGAYMIFKVNHSITPGNMTTTFTGMKMSKNCVPYVKEYVAREVLVGSNGDFYTIGGRIGDLIFPSSYPDGDYQRYKDIYYNTQANSHISDFTGTGSVAKNTIDPLRELFSKIYADTLVMSPNQNQSWNVHVNSTVRGDSSTSWHAYGVAMDLGIYNYNEQNSLTAKGDKTYLWYIMDLIMDKYYESYKIWHIIFEYTESNEINCLHVSFGNNQKMEYKQTTIKDGVTDINAKETNMEKIIFGNYIEFTKKENDGSTSGCWISKKGSDGKYHVTKSEENYYLYIASKYYYKCGDIDKVKTRFPSLPEAKDLSNRLKSYWGLNNPQSLQSFSVSDKENKLWTLINNEEGGFNNIDSGTCGPTYRGFSMVYQLDKEGDKAIFPKKRNFWEEFLKKYPFHRISTYTQNKKTINCDAKRKEIGDTKKPIESWRMMDCGNSYIENCVYGNNGLWSRYQFLKDHIGDKCADGSTLTEADVQDLENLLQTNRSEKYYKKILLDEVDDFAISALLMNFYYGLPSYYVKLLKSVTGKTSDNISELNKEINDMCKNDDTYHNLVTNLKNKMTDIYKEVHGNTTYSRYEKRMNEVFDKAQEYKN